MWFITVLSIWASRLVATLLSLDTRLCSNIFGVLVYFSLRARLLTHDTPNPSHRSYYWYTRYPHLSLGEKKKNKNKKQIPNIPNPELTPDILQLHPSPIQFHPHLRLSPMFISAPVFRAPYKLYSTDNSAAIPRRHPTSTTHITIQTFTPHARHRTRPNRTKEKNRKREKERSEPWKKKYKRPSGPGSVRFGPLTEYNLLDWLRINPDPPPYSTIRSSSMYVATL